MPIPGGHKLLKRKKVANLIPIIGNHLFLPRKALGRSIWRKIESNYIYGFAIAVQ
jgi:hypothetical protein